MSLRRKTVAIGTASLAVLLLVTWLVAVVAGQKKVPPPSKSDPLADLEQRISKLEKVGPFTVVDNQDRPIFTVTSTAGASAATVFDSNRVGVATMGATTDGGYFLARSGDGSTTARMSVERANMSVKDKTWAGLRLNELITETVTEQGVTHQVKQDVARLELGRKAAGNYSLTFPGKSGEPIAGIGESKAGSGALVVGDTQGSKRASVSVGESKGVIAVFNGAGNAIVALGEAVGNTGGALAIGDANSEPRVKMGTNDNRYGVVMTFPVGLPYVPRSGLPGSYFLGCAGGSACVP